MPILVPMTAHATDSDVIVRNKPLPPSQNPARVYLSRLGAGSRRTMTTALQTLAGLATSGLADATSLDWSALHYQHTQALRAKLLDAYAPATANKLLAALRGVLKEAWRLGQMDAEAYHRAADLPCVKSEKLPRGRALAAGEVRTLFSTASADRSPAGIRDTALLALAYAAGLRRAELVFLDVADFDRETGELRVRGGKGRKDRVGWVTNGSRTALNRWLKLRGNEPGPMFVPVSQTGDLDQRRRLSTQAVYRVLEKRAEAAGIHDVSPHDLRRSFVSDLLDAGADLAVVQRLAGHANIATTSRYDRRGEETKRRTAELLHVPVA